LSHPIANRLAGEFKFIGEFFGRSTGKNERDGLRLELRRIYVAMMLWHSGLSSPLLGKCPRNRVNISAVVSRRSFAKRLLALHSRTPRTAGARRKPRASAGLTPSYVKPLISNLLKLSSEARMKLVREISIIEAMSFVEADVVLTRPTKMVIACASFRNPFANTAAADSSQLTQLAELSYEIGLMIVPRALACFKDAENPSAYGKAAIVGLSGQREHGAAAIHLKLGLAMRRGLGEGPSLIPGNEKLGAPGSSIDMIFGDTQTGWGYNEMDSREMSLPGSPRADEILIMVGFATGGRPNARIAGASSDQVASLLRELANGKL